MRWRIKINHGPQIGDLRIHKSFALFPVKIGAFRVWLEPHFRMEKCFHVYGGRLGAKWVEEFTSFDLPSAQNYLAANYETFTYFRARDLYRDLSHPGQSPWYLNQSSQY